MRKEILLLAPDYYGFNEVVYEGFAQFGNGNVQNIVINEGYKYRSFFERIENFFSKLVLNKNLKSRKAEIKLTHTFENLPNKDFIIINRHDLLTTGQLLILRKKTSNLFCILWDSLCKIPQQKNNLNLFSRIYSFDSHDCAENGFQKINNFYFVRSVRSSTPSCQVSYLGTYDNRIGVLMKFFEYFKKNNITAFAKVYVYKSELPKLKSIMPENIQLFHHIIPFSQSYRISEESEVILDLAHENQRGLSFRPFEALGLRKKLITNNPEITKYDFYTPNNILVVDTSKPIVIPALFLASPYQEIDEKITDKYYIKSWVNKILSQDEA